jgi:glycosyltransferase involved in cell wall biosynthesis
VRILHVIQELGTGGAERIVLTLARGAQDAGHEVAVVAAPGPLADELNAERFDLPFVRRRPWRVPGAASAVRKAVREWRPDLVHAHNPGIAVAVRFGSRTPGLVSVHGVPEADWPAAVRALRLSRLPAVACGPGVEAALAEHSLEPLATIPNAVGPAPPPTALGHDGLVVLSVGRLVESKNHQLVIRALAGLPDTVLEIAGDGSLREELERVAERAGVSDRVRFLGERPDARALMGAADAVVLASRAEGLPLVALEALASGTPLVATAVRGLRELLTDGENALLVPPEDPDALAAALRRVLSDVDLAARLGEAGRRVPGAGSVDVMVSGFLALYEKLVA